MKSVDRKLGSMLKSTDKAYGFAATHCSLSLKALVRPYGLKLFLGGLLLVATNAVLVALPTLINAGVSLIESTKPIQISYLGNFNFSSIYTVIGVVIGLALVGAIIRTLSRMVIFDVGRLVERDVRKRLFDRMIMLDDPFYNAHPVGDIMNHLTSDVMNVRLLTGFAALNIMNIIIIFLFTVPVLFAINAPLAFCALLPFPLMALLMSFLSKSLFESSKKYQRELDNLVSHVQENLLGAHVVRLFHKQKAEGERFYKTNENTYEKAIKQAKIRALLLPLMRCVMGIAITLVLWVGSRAIMSGVITAGDFVEINARILQLTWPAMSIGFVMSMYSRGSASIERLNNLLAYEPQILDGPDELRGLDEVKVKNLALNNNQKDALSFTLKKGQMLAIVGMSGSFKSTFFRMLSHREQVPEGAIFFDQKDINQLTLSSLYRHLSFVTQEPVLFHKSIRDNICLQKPDASINEILEVLHITKLDADIKQFSNGIDTIIGERGITLSGGQRQRVVLSRALLAKKPLLILDDALSAVDADTEQHIISELHRYTATSMIIIATHHLATVKKAHHIIVLDKGAVVAEGNYEYLIKNSPLFKELWGFDQMARIAT